MKKTLFFLISTLSLISTNGSSDVETSKSEAIDKIYGNHIYFGPEVFLFNLNTHVKHVKVHGSKVFGGLRFRYEYLKPKAFYAGIDLFSAASNKSFHARIRKGPHFHQNNGITGFGNFEIRLGYTAAIEKATLTPFLGVGGYCFANNGNSFHFREFMLYYAIGLRSLFELNRSLCIGVNVKAFRTDDAEQKFWYKSMDHLRHLKNYNDFWGGEIGLPLIWYLGNARRWNVLLEPYFLKLDFSERQNIYGIRLLSGYRF